MMTLDIFDYREVNAFIKKLGHLADWWKLEVPDRDLDTTESIELRVRANRRLYLAGDAVFWIVEEKF